MNYRVVFAPEAEEQLVALYRYIAAADSPEVAARYTEAIVSYCETLQAFPNRGSQRSDVRPGLRVTNYKKRTVIAYAVDADQVSIIGVFYGGQDAQTAPLPHRVHGARPKRSVRLAGRDAGQPRQTRRTPAAGQAQTGLRRSDKCHQASAGRQIVRCGGAVREAP
ncbi:MAG: type II toxin-antitoxin system RelE/ParE family toxin [Rhodocyclaceae bacterium]|nr:type II toxin-antitoxin system RelE/ParE family toxin [Rhodocyclaceae bacterium]MBX3669623.1 type II toxin-antitoxin system RelE/ParE family toxin [Rhodocyclaceae bacterium]